MLKKQMFSFIVGAALRCLIIILLYSSLSMAMVVTDPANLAQTTLTAINTEKQLLAQIQSLQYQVKNMQDLSTKLTTGQLVTLQQNLLTVISLQRSSESTLSHLDNLQGGLEKRYHYLFPKRNEIDKMSSKQRRNISKEREAEVEGVLLDSVELSTKINGTRQDRKRKVKEISDTIRGLSNAEGQKQVMQSCGMLLSKILEENIKMTTLLQQSLKLYATMIKNQQNKDYEEEKQIKMEEELFKDEVPESNEKVNPKFFPRTI